MDCNNYVSDTHGGNVYKISREHGIDICDIIDFSANINPMGIPKVGKDAIIQAFDNMMHYPDPEYTELKKSIAEYHHVPSDWIIPSNGAIEALFMFMRALKPRKAFVAAPTFVEYRRAVEAVGAKYKPFYREKNFSINVDKFSDMIKYELSSLKSENNNVFIVCNPNNPTGTLTGDDDIKQIIKICNSYHMWTLIDEAFMDFAMIRGAKSIVSDFYEGQKIASMHSVTKFFAVPALRIGYIICPNDTMRDMMKRVSAVWSVNHFAEKFVPAVLNDKEYFHKTERWFFKESEFLYQALATLPAIKVYESFANYIFFKYDGDRDIVSELLKQNIAIRDCQNFDGLSRGYYRVAIKAHYDNVRLYKAIKSVLL